MHTTYEMNDLAISPDSQMIAGAGARLPQLLWIWEIGTGKLIRKINLEGPRPMSRVFRSDIQVSFAFDAKECRLYYSAGRTVQKWSPGGSAEPNRTLAEHKVSGYHIVNVHAWLMSHRTISQV